LVFPVTSAGQDDPVAQLNRRIDDGSVRVRYEDKEGYLPWLLEALDVRRESQMLVFSKTSIQALRIEPGNPRHLYFNDSVAIGTVRGGPIELMAQDPGHGLVFYLLDQRLFRYQEFLARPKPDSPITRRVDCMTCHVSKASGQPVALTRSVTAARNGNPMPGTAVVDTDIRTPFGELWGGWFVTGKITASHRGNTVFNDRREAMHIEPPESSDIVALMVFEHQMRIMSLIAGGKAEEIADALLFTGEPALAAPVEGTSGFAEEFSARGPRDGAGRSLRDFDLRRRLFRYPCSYMIYSPAFEGLTAEVKAAVYRRMWTVLAGRDAAERKAVVEILRGTKTDLPEYFAPQ
jgi:hypothetical protein